MNKYLARGILAAIVLFPSFLIRVYIINGWFWIHPHSHPLLGSFLALAVLTVAIFIAIILLITLLIIEAFKND